MTFSAIKTQEISTDRKCRLHLEKQFNIKLLSKNTGKKNVFFQKIPNPFKKSSWPFCIRIALKSHYKACSYKKKRKKIKSKKETLFRMNPKIKFVF